MSRRLTVRIEPPAPATSAPPATTPGPVTVAPSAAVTPVDTATATAPPPAATATDGGHVGGGFVFNTGYGQGVVQNLIAAAQAHDIGNTSPDDFKAIADVLRSIHDAGGSSTITDPTSGGTMELANIGKGGSKGHHGGFAFHH